MPTFDYQGREISYRTAGTAGPLVLFLHCSSSHSGQWKGLMETLSPRFRIVAPDLHGYGRSAPLPRDGSSFRIHDAGAVAALVEDAGAGPAHLVGHSMGATVAVQTALDHPAQVASVTLIEPVLFGLLEVAGDPLRLDYLQIAHDMMVLMDRDARADAAQRFMDFWMGAGAFDMLDAHTRDYVVATIDRVIDDWRGISHMAPDALGIADIAALDRPVELIWSDATHASVQAIMARLADSLPQARCRQFAGGGHMAPVTRPDLVEPHIRAALDRFTG
ncbi:alpha/beta fold hydrolase [Oceanomicrobium pacificus]|uniref:Alpha/beta fold hydrolase n=1 Tax=Oceanomicrobium pacificus TaxID=2692916 RepID=A0A6B0TKS5_9RHOB|nr:alpha/beta hydrolase [Oceanomicrobium pacificus]MXU65120.1 alpha/beta fold hydrolase [Oceanomicrobium pacificus]